jgi:NTF2-like protein (DUF6841)
MPDDRATGTFDARVFLDAYRDSFAKGPAAIASFYAEPCVTARMGSVRINISQSDTAALFSEVDKQYRARGYTHADYDLSDVRNLGVNAALVTARWSYKGADRQVIWRATFTYNLYKREEGWKILLQTMHDG